MVKQLGNVTVVVSDLKASLKFFRDKVGLRLAFFDRKHDWVCFDTGKAAFSLTVPWNKKSRKLVGSRTGLSFYVDDLAATYKALRKKQVKFAFKPRQEPWGGLLASFRDPDGNRFFLLQMPADFRK